MKTGNALRNKGMAAQPEDMVKKGNKLAPMKKSGKDKHFIYNDLDDSDDDEFGGDYRRKESVLDYFDDGEEDF